MNNAKKVVKGRYSKGLETLRECYSDEKVLDKESLFIPNSAISKILSLRTHSTSFVRPKPA